MRSDWIELRNTGNSVVNLAGWGLSDDPAQPMKWVFPATNLAPHSTLVVCRLGARHPNSIRPVISMPASAWTRIGGAVVLTASDGVTTVDSLPAYPELDSDLAYGRDLEGNWTFIEPTPGAINAGSTYLGWLKHTRLEPRARLLPDRLHPDPDQQQPRLGRVLLSEWH